MENGYGKNPNSTPGAPKNEVGAPEMPPATPDVPVVTPETEGFLNPGSGEVFVPTPDFLQGVQDQGQNKVTSAEMGWNANIPGITGTDSNAVKNTETEKVEELERKTEDKLKKIALDEIEEAKEIAKKRAGETGAFLAEFSAAVDEMRREHIATAKGALS